MMESNQFVVALLCAILYSLRSDAAEFGNTSPYSAASFETQTAPDNLESIDSTTSGAYLQEATSEQVNSQLPRTVYNDPFMLVGEDNILGPPRRRKLIRRTRRRRIKKLRSTTESPNEADISSSTGPDSIPAFSTLVESSTRKLESRSGMGSSTIRISDVPIDSEQSVTDELSDYLPSPSPHPPTTIPNLPDPILKSGHYTRHQRMRKRPNPKSSLWRNPNFSVELFEAESTNEEPTNNVDKRESVIDRNNTRNKNNYDMFSSNPTSLSNVPDMSTEESNPFVNTSLPISTELQNSLQFTLQVLHPLLNSDSVLSENEPKIPEDKTVAVTHSLSSSVAETPIAPDVRFLPTHLRKSHPLLSEDSFLNHQSASKVGPRVHVNGMHSIRNNPSEFTSSSTTENSLRNRGRFKISPSSAIPSRMLTSLRVATVPASAITTSEKTTVPTIRTSVPSVSPKRPFPTAVDNVHLEPIGNLKITEIVYPTVAQTGVELASSSTKPSSPTINTNNGQLSSSSVRPTPIFDPINNRSPPLILMGSDSEDSELDTFGKGNGQSQPIFDDLLLEELIKGFQPPTTTTFLPTPPPTTSTTTTTTTPPPPPPPPPPTTTSTTTTPQPTTTTTTTTTTEVPKPVDDETSQLLQLLTLLQSQQQIPQTTELITSTSPLTIPTTGKIDNDLIKNLELLENLLSPTAKTMIKEAVDAGTTEKIKPKNPTGGGEGLSDNDLKSIYMLLDAMSSTTLPPTTTTTTTTTPKPTIHPALQGMLTMLNNPWSEIQKMRNQQAGQAPVNTVQQTFSIPEPPKPVPTTNSLDLLSQLFNLAPQKPQTEKPKPVTQNVDFGLSSLFGSLLPKRTPNNREVVSGSNQLLSYFQPPPDLPASTPPPGPYYWLDMNAFLGNDPNAGPMSGFRPKIGSRDYFLKVRKRRNSMERYY